MISGITKQKRIVFVIFSLLFCFSISLVLAQQATIHLTASPIDAGFTLFSEDSSFAISDVTPFDANIPAEMNYTVSWVDIIGYITPPSTTFFVSDGDDITINGEYQIGGPIPPSNLVATAVDSVSIQLNWQDNSNDETGFEIERQTLPGGSFGLITTLGVDEISFVDTGLIPCTEYNYRVRGINANGPSSYSNESSAVTLSVPLPDSDFSASETTGFSPVSVQFTNLSEGATSWSWDFGDGSTSTQQNPLHIYSNSTPSIYTVTLIARNSCGDDTTVKTDLIFVDGVPTNLVAVSISTDSVHLTWQDNSQAETGFELDRRDVPSGSFANVATPGPDSNSYEDGGLNASSIYEYRLRALGNGTTTPYIFATVTTQGLPVVDFSSNITSGFSPMPVQFLDNSINPDSWVWDFGDGNTSDVQNPTHIYTNSESTSYTVTLTVTNTYGDNSVVKTDLIALGLSPNNLFVTSSTDIDLNVLGMNIVWQDNSNNEDGFQIYKETGLGNPFTLLTTLNAGEISYTDFGDDTTVGLDSTQRYAYRVRAFTSDTVSAYTNDGFVYALANFLASPTSGFFSSGQATITITELSKNADEWHWDFGDGNTFDGQSPGSHMYSSDTNAVFYITESVNNIAYGLPHTFTQQIDLGLPPTDLSATPVSTTQIDLSWLDNANNEIGYQIERQVSGGGYSLLTTLGENANSYSDNGLQPNTNYDYQVRAITSETSSDFSNVASALTPDLAYPKALFTATPIHGFSPLFIQFADQSQNTNQDLSPSWLWDFGDGGNSNLQSPSHTYSSPTITSYSVSLILSNIFGSNTSIRPNFITVGPLGVFGNTPDLKFQNNSPGFGVLDLDNYTTVNVNWSAYAGNDFAKPAVDGNHVVTFNTPANNNPGQDTVSFLADETSGYASIVKYSTYQFKKLPSVVVDNGTVIENDSINLASSNYLIGGTPSSWLPPQIRPQNSSDNFKVNAEISDAGVLTVTSNGALVKPVDVIVSASPGDLSNSDKEIVRVYEVLNSFGRLTVSSDTSAYGFEDAPGATNGKPGIIWQPSYQGSSGVLRLSFTMTNQGIKLTPFRPFYIPTTPNTWYTVRVRATCNATTNNNTFSPALYAYNGVPPNPTEISAAVAFSIPTTWTWFECPIYTTGSTLYPQIIIKNYTSSLKNVYIDDIEVVEKKPAIRLSYGNTKVRVAPGDFDNANDLFSYAFESPPGGTLSSYAITNGTLDVTITGASGNPSGLKLTGITGANQTLTTGTGNGGVGISANIYTTGSFADALVLVAAFGTNVANGTAIKDLGAYATVNKVPGSNGNYTATAAYNTKSPYIYHQVIVKGSGNAHYYLDNIYPEVDTDTIYYWDHSLFQ